MADGTYEAFRRKMRFHRQQTGMSQQELATRMGVSVWQSTGLGDQRPTVFYTVLRWQSVEHGTQNRSIHADLCPPRNPRGPKMVRI